MNVPGSLPPVARAAEPRVENAGRAPRAGAASASSAPPSSLWDLLTPEEREFFTQQTALGPITYRPGSPSPCAAAAPTGQRVDVRG
jgi:hypothetical protein